MEKAKTRKIKKWDEVHGEHEVEVSDNTGGCELEEVAGASPSISRNPMRSIEDMVEQNDNSFDGIINNTPTVDELEAKVKAGETISLVDLANAVKADRERGKEAKPEKKPSIRAQLRADKEKAQKKNAKQKSQDLERS